MTIRNLNIVQTIFNAIFKKIAILVVRYPLFFIFAPLLTTLGLSMAFFKFRFEDDPEYLFTMSYGRAREHRQSINALFPLSELQNYDYGRETRIISGYGRILITAKDGQSSIFRPEIREEIQRFNDLIEKITIIHDKIPYDYQAICARYYKKCQEQSVTFAFDELDKNANKSVKFKYPLYLSEDKLKFHFFGMFFGGVSLDSDGNMIDAKLAHLVYFVDTKNDLRKEISIKWEKEFLNVMVSHNLNFTHIKYDYLTSHALPEEFVKAGNRALPIFFVTASFMVLFSMAACMLSDCTKSKPWIGVLGCLSSLMGVLSGCGICVLLNIPFPPSNYAVPFILVGIGIDDTFIFLAAWRNTNPKKSLEERIIDTYVHSGVAITVTSLTNVISFGACVVSYIPGLQIFGEYSAASCIFAYIYQISFIGGCLVYLAKMEINNYNGNFLICKSVPESQANDKPWLYRFLFTGGVDPEFPDKPPKDQWANVFFRDIVGKWLTNRYARAMVLMSFILYFSFALFGCYNLEIGMEFGQLFPEDSFAHQFWKTDSEYLSQYRYRLQVVINSTIDYSDVKNQERFLGFVHELTSLKHVSSEPLLAESWLGYYLSFLNETKGSFWIRGYNLTKKSDFINCLRFVFFKMPQAQRFRNDIKFNANFTDIVATRFFVQLYDTREIAHAIDAFVTVNDVIDKQPFQSFMFQPLLIYMDTILSVKMITFSTIFISVVAILVVTFIFIPNLVVAFWVAFSIISIELGVVGYIHFMGFALNPATMFGLLIYLGLSVDNAAHITYAYASSKETNPDLRLRDSLYHVGLPILQGCTSTILGLSALSLIPSYLYESIYKIGIMVMVFSAFHSIALLPLLLSMFYKDSKKPNEPVTKELNQKNGDQSLTPFLKDNSNKV